MSNDKKDEVAQAALEAAKSLLNFQRIWSKKNHAPKNASKIEQKGNVIFARDLFEKGIRMKMK